MKIIYGFLLSFLLVTNFALAKNVKQTIVVTCPASNTLTFYGGMNAEGFATTGPTLSGISPKIQMHGDTSSTKANGFIGATYGEGSLVCAYNGDKEQFGIITYCLYSTPALQNCHFKTKTQNCHGTNTTKCQLLCDYY